MTFLTIWKTRRYMLSILMCCGFINVFALRTNLSIAIVDMTQIKNVTLDNGTIISKREFDWDSKLQGYVLSSFFYGYVTTQIIGGYLAIRLGGTKVYGFGIAVTAFLTILTPVVAKCNVYLLIAVRALEGIFEGVTYPACNAIWTNWAPPLERTRLATIGWSGSFFGTVISMPVSSLLASYFGWESIFYVFGSFGLLWYVIWLLYARDTPNKDTRISGEELAYITKSINSKPNDDSFNIPIYKYITSLPVWATVAGYIAEYWGFNTLLTGLPNFMKNVLNFDLNSAGLLSGAPYLAVAVMIQVAGYAGDRLIERKVFNKTNTRKIFTIIGFTGQTIFLLLGAFLMSPTETSICVVMAVGVGAFAMAGFGITTLELAPKYAGITNGYCNTFGAMTGILSPIVTGYLVTDQTNVYQWRKVFYLSAILYIFGAVVFSIFGSSEIQPWSTDESLHNEAPKKVKSVEKNKDDECATKRVQKI